LENVGRQGSTHLFRVERVIDDGGQKLKGSDTRTTRQEEIGHSKNLFSINFWGPFYEPILDEFPL
jgi:hypothetical protein